MVLAPASANAKAKRVKEALIAEAEALIRQMPDGQLQNGGSGIYAPDGSVLARAGAQAEIIGATLDMAMIGRELATLDALEEGTKREAAERVPGAELLTARERLAILDQDSRKLQILKERYEPGADTGRVPLSHEGEEGGIVLSGRLEVTVDAERRILGPGDAYSFDSRRPHRFRCVGPNACEVVSACTPPTF